MYALSIFAIVFAVIAQHSTPSNSVGMTIDSITLALTLIHTDD
jgi:hypothetical protein